MAEKNAKIFIKSSQILDNEKDDIEIMTECSFYKNKEKYHIFYTEVYENGITECSIKYDSGAVHIKRKGDTNANFVCKLGEDTAFIYSTQYGHFSVTVHTKKLEVNLDESGGNIYMEYDLNISGINQENIINIKITGKDK